VLKFLLVHRYSYIFTSAFVFRPLVIYIIDTVRANHVFLVILYVATRTVRVAHALVSSATVVAVSEIAIFTPLTLMLLNIPICSFKTVRSMSKYLTDLVYMPERSRNYFESTVDHPNIRM